jgi:hypothetical protein
MNNNNLYNTNNFIGITHNDYFKVASNALAKEIYIQSNIVNNNCSNYASNISNVLNYNSSNYTNITSNIIQTNINKIIKEEIEHITLPISIDLTHTYIYNSNVLGEIRFWCESTSSFPVVIPLGVPDYRVKIDVDGKLKCYYTYDPLINLTFGNGWIDVGNSIVALNAADANFTITISGLEAQIQASKANLNDKIDNLLQSFLQQNLISQTDFNSINSAIRNLENITSQGARGSVDIIYNNIRSAFLTGRNVYFQEAINNINLAISQNAAVGFAVGIGGAAFFAICQALQNLGYINTISASINEYINSNLNLTRELKDDIMALNVIEDTKYYIKYCENISNATLAQGFINSNILDTQYISSLKTDNLNINSGNINGIDINNLKTSTNIIENGSTLSSKYLTSNHIYNMTQTLTSERQYPPKAYTTATVEDVVSLLGKSVYHQTLYLNNSIISYGSGFYEIYSSSTYDNGITNKDKLFNHYNADIINPRWGINLYNSGTGNYQGNDYIINNYYGDWIIIKLPFSILLTKFKIYSGDTTSRSPAEWKCYGSNDGIIFTEITEGAQTSRLVYSDYLSGYYEKTLNSSFTTQYQYIGFVFNKIVSISGYTDLCFGELRLYGKETETNNITSQIYTTSNVVKGIVQYEMDIIAKHYGFYITVNTAININGITYYKYDIDLSQYTKKGYIQIGGGSNDPYRIFKIRAFYGTSYFGTLINGLPDVVYADIFMSYKAAASPPNGVAGLNICSIGNINNPTLTAVPPNNLFFMRNGADSIDYITVVSKTASDVRCIVEDLLG